MSEEYCLEEEYDPESRFADLSDENREFGLLDFIVFPSAFGKLLLCNLKGVAQKCIVLLCVVDGQRAEG